MDVMSRSSVRAEYVVITELYKGGKQESHTRAAFSMELLFDMLCAIDIRNDTVGYPSRACKYKKQQ